jgi:DNA-binding winged helix-turn-helix (wHTH) protein
MGERSCNAAYFIMEKGLPYKPGASILLQGEQLVVGRATHSSEPDIGFSSALISRNHCRVELADNAWVLTDLDSRNGTAVNGHLLTPSVPYPLKPGDEITLASGVISFRFVSTRALEETIEIDLSKVAFCIDPEKLKLQIDAQEVELSAKEWILIALLYKHRNSLVDYDTIKCKVWSERCWQAGLLPEVGVEELSALIHRLRRKLGTQGNRLRTVRGRGCILEV